MKRRALLVFALAGCATVGSDGQGDVGLPTSGVGPFRKLGSAEVPGIAPFVLDERRALFRDPAAVARGVGDDGPEVWLYAVARDAASGKDVIVRSRATDGRSFYGTTQNGGRTPPVVLAPTEPWEGDALSGPAPLVVGGTVYLYYAGRDGIGRARSSDGVTFTKDPGPIFTRDPAVAFEIAAPSSPSVARLPSGRYLMFYAGGAGIGEAESDDGLRFARKDALPSTPAVDPVLDRALPVPGEPAPFDAGEVADPHVMPRVTAAGRLHVRVLYTGYDRPRGASPRVSAIGFAARYGEAGPLERGGPVYSVGKAERAPSAVEWGGKTLLYVEQSKDGLGGEPYRAIAGALAPADQTLGAPAAFPEGP